MTFDGEPLPNKASKIFRVLQRDAAIHAAIYECIKEGSVLMAWWQCVWLANYLTKETQAVLADIAAKRGSITCSFRLRPTVDVKRIVHEKATFTFED